MRGPWWSPVWYFTQHMLMYSTCFAVLALSAAYGSVLIELASHAIASKFTLYILTFLEYAAVIADAIFILLHLLTHLRETFKRIVQ